MRNDNAKWTIDAGNERANFITGSVQISRFVPARQTLISGPYPAALEHAGLSGAAGWPKAVSEGMYALRLRRDRILVVNGPDQTDGWHVNAGVAVSDMTDGYSVIDLKGTDAFEVLRRGTEISRNISSASVARNFFGYPVLIYAVAQENGFRIHTPRSHGHNLWMLLEEFSKQAAKYT